MATPPPLTCENLQYWKQRFSKITADTPRQFGKLDPPAMFRHLRRTIEPIVGDYEAEDISNFFTRLSLFHEIFLLLPWPKGKVVAPEWITPPAEGDLEHERDALFEIMDRFVAMHDENPKALTKNALLGNVTLSYTSRLQGKHLNHHAEQFGV